MTHNKTLPGDMPQEARIHRMLRVDHAGEYGAMRIYAGQLAFTRDTKTKETIQHMAAQEKRHLETFEQLMRQRRVRPTALMPLWHVAGYAMGAATALLGKEAAMACTVAVESVINEHYQAQHAQLGEDEKSLAGTIEEFRREEVEHHDTGLREGAEQAPFYSLLSGGIKAATRTAIWLSSRV